VARAFINACSHRGANVATEERGHARRFVCPYHGWTFDQQGALRGVAAPEEFGAVDKNCYSLRALPTVERSGLIWVVLDRRSTLDIDAFLSGYDALLERFGFKDWHFFGKRVIKGPNWKVAYDGYLDYYHIPVLHRETFGPDMLNQAIYSAFGPHQRVQFPLVEPGELATTPEEKWPDQALMDGVWTIFPHISIASFGGGGRGVMISQLLPGDTVDTSWTTQMYLMEKAPEGEEIERANEQFAFLRKVVEDEDYFTGLRLQRALKAGGLDVVTFGRNETGAQCFHGWVDKVLKASDAELNGLFRA
jgi:phenylpropionate dioxygenase-like ring-hydroxylating dioxygenase large terminal subunit